MFGYVRIEKPDLLIRDFTIYKSVYCGLCKAIGRRAGQIPRGAVTYDMTFLSLLLMALSVEDPWLDHESCILNPFKKKPVIKSHPILDYTADMSSLLAYYSAKDDAQDDRPIKGRAMAALFSRSARRARRLYPELSKTIADELTRLNAMEPYESPERLAATFGLILEALMRQGIELLNRHDEPFFVYADLLETAANALGQWVYLLDAVDDLEEDKRKKNHNPFLRMEQDEAMTLARTLLIEREETIDRHLSLIDYERFGAIVYNIVTIGLPATRERILLGEKLPAL